MGTDVVELTWAEVSVAARQLAHRHRGSVGSGQLEAVHGVPRGGLVPAALVAGYLDLPLTDRLGANVLVVDDLVDSGATRERYRHTDVWAFDALYVKSHSPGALAGTVVDGWLVFPWERTDDGRAEVGPEDAVTRLIEWCGDDPNRDGLRDTPRRVVAALAEMTGGRELNPEAILGTTFELHHDEMIVVDGIDFTSVCEHHMLPFLGTACVGYVPGDSGRVVGLSKIPRLVECFARRLQIQERLTEQVAYAMQRALEPQGVGVVIRARHLCLACRGARKSNVDMVTSCTLGLFRDDPRARAEFLALAR